MAKPDVVAAPKSAAERANTLQKRVELGMKGAVKVFRTTDKPEPHPVISSGSLAVDVALGGGYGKGRIVEIYGPEAGGKTTMALTAIASVQRNGGVAAFVDAEHALDLKYAASLGVKTEELLIVQPDMGEQALEAADTFVEGMIAGDIVVIDSVAALVPKAELEGDIGDQHVGLQGRMMGQALRKMSVNAARQGVVVIFINQIRDVIGAMAFGPKTSTPGGKALKFYASHRLDVHRIGSIKEPGKGDEDAKVTGNRVEIKIAKNKLAPPFTAAEVTIYFGKGVSKAEEVFDLAVAHDIIKKNSSSFSYANETFAVGRGKAVTYIEANPEFLAELEASLRELLLPQVVST